MKKVPQIRFKGYTGDWEQRKVGDIAGKAYGGGTPKTSIREYWNGNIPWIQSSNLTEHELFTADIQKHITDTGLQKSATRLVPKNSIAVVSHVGVGKLVFMPFEYTTSQDFISLSDLKSEPIFTCYALYKRLQEDLHIVQGSAIKGITKDTLLNKEIMVPSVLEQKKIGMALKNFDHLITLHQRKCEETKKFKKFMLQKMFPQNGTNIPEIRFEGFTDAWEQRKLSDISDVRDGTHDSPKYVQEGHPFITSKNVSNGFINYDDIQYVSDEDFEEINKRSKVDIHDILMGMIGTIGNLALVREKPDFAIKNIALIKYTGAIDYDFLYQALQTNYVVKQLSNGMDGGTQKFIALKKIRGLDIPCSSDKEQKKIGEYFLTIDHLITLHQRKLETLRTLKKFMLEKMFV